MPPVTGYMFGPDTAGGPDVLFAIVTCVRLSVPELEMMPRPSRSWDVALFPLIVLLMIDITPWLVIARRRELLTVDPRIVTCPLLLMAVEWLPSKVLSRMSTTPPVASPRLPGLR